MEKRDALFTKLQNKLIMKRISLLLCLCLAILGAAMVSGCSKDESTSGAPVGKGGSLARFTIAQNHLYVVDGRDLHTFSLADPQNPVKVHTTGIGMDIETIYTWKDKLFIGSQEAMFIYSIANPAEPKALGQASHVRACDPVVANDTVAYVTVRTGSNCGGDVNALLVYNLNYIMQPTLMNTIAIDNPHGLGLQGNTLFVCDGTYGLRVYDVADAYFPTQIKRISGEKFYDCIPNGNILICMIEGGMALFDITDRNNISLLSKITD